ncbi:acyltransferase [bacterium]|nr:acyltransferase [bacterium]
MLQAQHLPLLKQSVTVTAISSFFDEFAMKNPIGHFFWLDLIRFLAALVVVLGHVKAATFVEFFDLIESDKSFIIAAAFGFARLGHEAVLLFFVMSGFLVGGRAIERMIKGSFRPYDYAIDRIVRIMLPLVPALILTMIIRLIIDGNFDPLHLVGNLFSLQGIVVPPFGENIPLWSLSYEVWFYFLAFIVGVAFKNGVLSTSIQVSLITVFLVFSVLNATYLFCWLVGAMAFLTLPDHFKWTTFIFSCVLCLLSIFAIQVGVTDLPESLLYIEHLAPSPNISRLLFSLSVALLLQQLIRIEPKGQALIKLEAAGTVLALSSYTLYLTHLPIIQLLIFMGIEKKDSIGLASVSIFILVTVVCLLASWLLYLMFEKHTILVRLYIKTKFRFIGSNVSSRN